VEVGGSGLLFLNWGGAGGAGVLCFPTPKKKKKTFGVGWGARLLFFKFVNQTLEK